MTSNSLLLLAFVFAIYFFTHCFSWRQVLVNGWQVIDVKNENIHALLTVLQSTSKGFAKLDVVNVVHAEVMMDPGIINNLTIQPRPESSMGQLMQYEIMYNLTIQTRPKSSMGQPTTECHLLIGARPLQRRYDILRKHCYQLIPKPVPLSLPIPNQLGVWYKAEIDENVRTAADFGMYQVNRRFNSPYTKLVYEINGVKMKMLLPDTLYNIHVTIIQTFCRDKESNLKKSWPECGFDPSEIGCECLKVHRNARHYRALI